MDGIQSSLLGIGDFVSDIGDVFESVGDFFSFMTEPHSYLRIFEVVFGAILVIGALRYGQ